MKTEIKILIAVIILGITTGGYYMIHFTHKPNDTTITITPDSSAFFEKLGRQYYEKSKTSDSLYRIPPTDDQLDSLCVQEVSLAYLYFHGIPYTQ